MMILIEAIQNLVRLALRFLVWIVTARDCEHCKFYYVVFGTKCCKNPHTECCINTITRKYFERAERGKR